MQADGGVRVVSSGGSKFAQTTAVAASKFVALAALGLVLAYWTWAWLAPATLPPAQKVSEPSGRLAAAGKLFGHEPDGAPVATSTGLAIKLLGVIAGQPQGSGYALLQLDAKDTHVVRSGGEVAPGVRVESVLPQQVILQRAGARETLAWPQPGQTPETTTSSPTR